MPLVPGTPDNPDAADVKAQEGLLAELRARFGDDVDAIIAELHSQANPDVPQAPADVPAVAPAQTPADAIAAAEAEHALTAGAAGAGTTATDEELAEEQAAAPPA